MSASTIYGRSLQEARRYSIVTLDSLTLNTTKVFIPLFVPTGHGPIRINSIRVIRSAVLAQAGGTSTITVTAGQPGALATIVATADILGGTADTAAALTLAAETSAKELTLEEGALVKFSVAVSNNALGTNGAVTFQISWHPVPDELVGNDVKHASFYRIL